MQLLDAGQEVKEHGIERSAEGKSQGDGSQASENPNVFVASSENGDQGQKQGQDTNIAASLDVVLDPPVDGIDGITVIIACHRAHLLVKDVEIAVMAGVAEKVGDKEGDEASEGVSPPHHLLVTGRALSEAAAHQLVEGDKLHRPQCQAQHDHDYQPEKNSPHPADLLIC